MHLAAPAKLPAADEPARAARVVRPQRRADRDDSGLAATAGRCACGGGCPRCRAKVQAKIGISAPGDRYEREADRAADAISASSRSSGRPVVSPITPLTVMRSGGDGVPANDGWHDSIGARLDSSAARGAPLPAVTRERMERGFGADLSAVRVHADDGADRLNRDLGARAFTRGSDIYFRAGRYQPGTALGDWLIAHEVAHVLQQSGGTSVPLIQRQVDEAALDQCIAELGGSIGYRDGGLPSPEELQRYRSECLARQGSSHEAGASSAIENLARAWGYAREQLGDEVRREVENLFSPASLAMMAAFAAVYLASQLTPVGWVADAFALVALSATVLFVGLLAFNIATDLYRFFSAINATSEDELRESGHALARALARGGVGIFIALLSHGMRAPTRPGPPTAPATALVEVAAFGGRTARITAATAEEAVQASRLQGLASYAVMVPPPGGAEPASPTSSSGGGSGRAGRGGRGSEGTPEPAAPGFRLGPVRYGEGSLSQLAQRMRLAIGLRRGGNVAVFEFDNIPAAFRSIADRLGGRNVLIEGNRMAVQNVNGSAHSEELAHMLISAGRRSGLELNVRRIYTEYNPCTDTCLPLIREYYPNVEVTFSFIWELWGRQTPDRNAAVEALFSGSTSGSTGH
jgi:Domain of unknown function (DUF4157)